MTLNFVIQSHGKYDSEIDRWFFHESDVKIISSNGPRTGVSDFYNV